MSAEEREMRILDEIRSIPEGFVRTYGDVSPGAPRLAGRLLGSVHAADLPWWRVVRADGIEKSLPQAVPKSLLICFFAQRR